MRVILGGKNNLYSAVFNSTAKTLTISGVTEFDLTDTSIDTIWDVTASKFIPCKRGTMTYSYVAGLPVWVFTFFSLPSGVTTGDTLVITLQIPDSKALYSVNQYTASRQV